MRSMRRELGAYLLWQLPGWVGLAVALGWLTAWLDLPWWVAPLGVGLLALKDLALFPAIRQTFGPSRLGERLIGAPGRTVEPLAPAGYVRVKGELWKARPRQAGRSIPGGCDIVVHDAHGLTLIVDEPTERP